MGFKVIERKGPPHQCNLPGWYRRWRLGLSFGSVVECDVCGKRYRWNAGFEIPYWIEVSGDM